LTIYLIDEPWAKIGLEYASSDPGAKIVLLQDAVHLARVQAIPGEVFTVADDIWRRGLTGSTRMNVKYISYQELVVMMEQERVVCFL
jgi:sulfur transfer complex TusBCD TusB component (DsrH family)